MKKRNTICKNQEMVTRVIDDETILLPIYKTSDEINCIYTLNKAASRVWQMCDENKTITQIKKEILSEFDVTKEEVDEKIKELFKDFKEIKAIK